jgi:hypothetical protein
MLTRSRWLTASLLALGVSSAHATATSYSSRADFLSVLGPAPVITQDFEGLAPGNIIADGAVIDGATFSYTLSGGAMILVDDLFSTTSRYNYLGTDDGSGAFYGGDSFTIHFSQPMYAIGLYAISADTILDGDFTITTSRGQTASNVALADLSLPDGEAYFIGLIEDDAGLGFDSITLSSSAENYLFNIDDISVAAVPLPAAAWLFVGGLLGLTGMSHRTRHNA